MNGAHPELCVIIADHPASGCQPGGAPFQVEPPSLLVFESRVNPPSCAVNSPDVSLVVSLSPAANSPSIGAKQDGRRKRRPS